MPLCTTSNKWRSSKPLGWCHFLHRVSQPWPFSWDIPISQLECSWHPQACLEPPSSESSSFFWAVKKLHIHLLSRFNHISILLLLPPPLVFVSCNHFFFPSYFRNPCFSTLTVMVMSGAAHHATLMSFTFLQHARLWYNYSLAAHLNLCYNIAAVISETNV